MIPRAEGEKRPRNHEDGKGAVDIVDAVSIPDATRSLSRLVEGVDFLLMDAHKQNLGSGGHNRETAIFSREGC